MSTDKKDTRKFSRRDFLKGAAIVTAAAAGSSVIAACGNAQEPQVIGGAPAAPEQPAAPAATTGGSCKPGFMTPPTPITADQIVQTVEADVVVVGAGSTGLSAAVSAKRAGAKTILLQKGPMALVQGWGIGAFNTDAMKAAGIPEVDVLEAINTQMLAQGSRPSFELIKLWADNSADSIKFLDEILVAKGHKPAAAMPVFQSDSPRDRVYPLIHNYEIGFMSAIMEVVEETAKEEGVEFHYNTPAVQLIREGQGRVTGVIGKNEEGEYVQFNAKKGVVLCTGCFSQDKEMMEHYIDWAADLPNIRAPKMNTGDGHKIAMWVGAAMETGFKAPIIHYDPSSLPEGDAPFSAIPWLYVNALGKRFENEDIPYIHISNADCTQPGKFHWQLFDSKWDEQWMKMGMGGLGRFPLGPDPKPLFEDALSKGAIKQANSIEELAGLMGVQADVVVATVSRYNELANGGKDLDFGKNPTYLFPIENAPFYAVKRQPAVLAVAAGLDINLKLQVKDTEGNVIPGLYAAGNTSGNFFANDYPLTLTGASNGRAVTFGRLAGQYAAAEEV